MATDSASLSLHLIIKRLLLRQVLKERHEEVKEKSVFPSPFFSPKPCEERRGEGTCY